MGVSSGDPCLKTSVKLQIILVFFGATSLKVLKVTLAVSSNSGNFFTGYNHSVIRRNLVSSCEASNTARKSPSSTKLLAGGGCWSGEEATEMIHHM